MEVEVEDEGSGWEGGGGGVGGIVDAGFGEVRA